MADWPTIPKPADLLSNRYKPTDMPDLTGKTALVVGGSRGIGEAVSLAMAEKGAEVHILSATPEHAETAVSNIQSRTSSSPTLHTHTADLGDLSDLHTTATSLAEKLPRLDVLYLIAGIGVSPWGLTKSGLGNHFAVNNVAQMLLTDIFLPLLKKTAEGKNGEDKWTTRIVSESSELHRTTRSELKFATLEEVGEQAKDEQPLYLYGMSKLGNILFIRTLAQSHLPALSSSSSILALSVHPGGVSTEQEHGATEAYGALGKVLETVAPVLFMDKEQGAESALWAGTSPAVGDRREEVQGRYFTEADGKVDTESDQAKDQALARAHWELCKKALKDKINYDLKM